MRQRVEFGDSEYISLERQLKGMTVTDLRNAHQKCKWHSDCYKSYHSQG